MRLALAGAGLVLLAGMTAACGGGADDAPEDASKEDFCEAWGGLEDAAGDEDKAEEFVDDMQDTGTPENISDDAREGFVLYMDFVDEHKGDSEEDIEKAAEDVDKDDRDKIEEFISWASKTCV